MMINNTVPTTGTTTATNNTSSDDMVINDTVDGGDVGDDVVVADVDHNNIITNNNSNNNQTVTSISPLPTQPKLSSSLSSQHLLLSSQQQQITTNANPQFLTTTLTAANSPNVIDQQQQQNQPSLSSLSSSPIITSASCRLSSKKKTNNKKQKNNIISNLNLNNFNNNNNNNNPNNVNNKSKRNSFLSLSSFNNNNVENSNETTMITTNENQQQLQPKSSSPLNENNINDSFSVVSSPAINEMIIHHHHNSSNNNNNNNNNNNSINDHHHIHNPHPHPHQHHSHNNNTNNNEMIAQVTNDPILSAYPNMDLSETKGITKRTVIIHKDSRGYGIRISGDNPVFIQHVNEEGAAYRAGVRPGDHIIKVNGTLVTRLGHTEVVNMIKNCGSFVGLTLLSKAPSTAAIASTANISSPSIDNQSRNLAPVSPTNSPTPPSQQSSIIQSLVPNLSPSHAEVAFSPIYPMEGVLLANNNSKIITGPQPVPVSTQQHFQENSIRTLKEMLKDELRHLEELKLMCAPKIELERCQKRISEIKMKLELHQINISSSFVNVVHSRQQSLDNDFRNCSSQHQTSVPTNNNTVSGMTSPRIIPMDDDVDIDPDGTYQQQYEDIDNLEPYDRDTASTSKPITKSVSNPTPILRSNQGNDTTKSNNNRDKTKRDSKILSSIMEQQLFAISPQGPQWWLSLNQESLRICRYLIQQMIAPKELLFYVMAKMVFPQIVTTSINNKSQVIKRWAYQIIATFIIKESPLFMREFPTDYLEKFDRNLNALISANPSTTDVVASPFDPFLSLIFDVVRKQWDEFMTAAHRQRLPPTSNPKHDLQSCIEMLLTTHLHICSIHSSTIGGTVAGGNNIQAKLDLRDIDSILDSFIQHVKLNKLEPTMALISSLLAIGRYVFKLNPSKHCLLLETSGAVGSLSSTSNIFPLATIVASNPLSKLSSETSNNKKSGQKRTSMIPIGSKSFSSGSHVLGNSFDSTSSTLSLSNNSKSSSQISGAIIEDHSHCFVPIIEMDHIIYCASFNCMLPMWGDPYTLKCTKCLMHTHLWCRKHAAANNTCNNDTQHQHQNSQSSQSGKQSNRRVKSEKKSVFEKITGKRTSKRTDFSSGGAVNRSSSSDSNSTSDSSSSLEFSSDCEEPNIPPTSITKHEEEMESSNKTVTGVSQNHDLPVNRSGSFVQRKKKKSTTSVGSPRKRSDPALTSKQISTMSGNSSNTGTGTIPQLTSARSSGALMNSASVGAHDSQFRPITGQRAKHLTSSDSSLISATSAASKMKSTPSSSGVANIFANNDSNKSSSTNLTSTSSPRKTRHRNTNDSAIQMDGSSEDDLNDFGQCNEPSNEELNEKDVSDVPPAPPPPPPFSNPPPLPPRPDSEKRRQIQMEIIQTEEEHYEVLRYIRKVYQKPLKKEKLLTHEQMDIIFGNVKELRKIHRSIFAKLNAANKNQMLSMNPDLYHLEKAIHEIFCGDLGQQLETEASKFCVNRKIRNGIELWNSKKKDSRFKGLVDTESRTRLMPENPFARLNLDDLLSRVFQRPLRYPLLFERLLKSTPKDSQGYRHLEDALISCRKSGERINEATKKAELKARLAELIRKTDFSSFSNQSLIENLEQHELLHEGPLIWRITKTKLVEVLLLLTDRIILVLTRDSSDRYSLKSHSNPNQNNKLKLGHRPDIKMDDLLMRDVATDHAAFFLVSKSQDIIYEFAATKSTERNKWKEVITKAIEEYHKKHQHNLVLQSQKSFTSTRSLTMTDLKTQISSSDDVAPPLPPPSILNRPLPKPPSESSPPPPPLPPPSSSFINRPLPKPPIDVESPSPSSSHHQPKYDGSIKFVSPQDCRPSTVEMVPFSQIQISPNSRISLHQDSKSNDLKEINDNIKNSIQECQRSGRTNLEDLEREIQEMSMVYDVAKHDADSKETLSRLITDMFRKATEWSYHLVQDNEPAKQELSQRVRNSVESFVKSHIDLNFILPLPNDVNQEDDCTDSLFTNANRDIDDVDGTQESLIIPINSCQLNSPNPLQYSSVQRSLSDKSNKSTKSQKPGLNPNHIDQNTSNTNDNFDAVDGDLDSENDEFIQNCQQLLSKSSPSPNPFDLKSSKLVSSMASPVQQISILSNPFLDHNTNDNNEIMTTFNTNLEISSIGVEEFVSTPDNEDNVSNENNDDAARNIDHINNNEQQFSDDRTNETFDVNNDQSLNQTLATQTSSNQTQDAQDNNQSAVECSTVPTASIGSSTTKTSQTYMI